MSYCAVIDSDVLINALRQDLMTTQILEGLGQQGQLAVSVITRLEIVIGCRDKVTLQRTERLLKAFVVLPVNESISQVVDELVTFYHLSNGMRIADALIGATALYHGLPLLTKNQRDFRFIPGLKLLPYPPAA